LAWPLILAALSLALAQSLAQTLLINHVLLDGRNIAVPRAYASYAAPNASFIICSSARSRGNAMDRW
jgi:hypothetical protein